MWLFQAFGQISRGLLGLTWWWNGQCRDASHFMLKHRGIMKHTMLTFTPKTHVLSFCDAFLGFNRFATKNFAMQRLWIKMVARDNFSLRGIQWWWVDNVSSRFLKLLSIIYIFFYAQCHSLFIHCCIWSFDQNGL